MVVDKSWYYKSKLKINGLDGILGFIIKFFYYNISFGITNVYV